MHIGREKFHGGSQKFYDFIQAKYPSLLDLGLGVRLHTEEDRGADYYSDDDQVGFAVLNAPKLADQVSGLLELTTKGVDIPLKFGVKFNSNSWLGRWKKINAKIALILAHNFIEGGVELNLIDSDPKLVKQYRANLARVDKTTLVPVLAEYLETSQQVARNELEAYLNTIEFKDTRLEALVESTVLPLIEGKFKRQIDRGETKKILLQAKALTVQYYPQWLDIAAANMRSDFARYL